MPPGGFVQVANNKIQPRHLWLKDESLEDSAGWNVEALKR